MAAAALVDSLSQEVAAGGRERKRPERFAAFDDGSDDDEDGRRRTKRRAREPKADGGDGKERKNVRCGRCAGCMSANCGKCVNCKDMPKYGGKGTVRQTCKQRQCEVLAEIQREEAMKKAVQRAQESEERAKERETERQERELERAHLASKRNADRALEREEKMIEKGALRNHAGVPKVGPIGKGRGVRTPTVTLEEGMGGGWGEHEQLEPGCRVEVQLEDEALDETIYAGRLVPTPPAAAGKKTRKQPPKAPDEHEGEVEVEFDELLESNDSDARLREWTSRSRVRRQPPPTPTGFFGLLHRGDKVQLLYEDCWWDVQFDEVVPGSGGGGSGAGGGDAAVATVASVEDGDGDGDGDGGGGGAEASAEAADADADAEATVVEAGGPLFRVSSLKYAKTHTVSGDVLRPQWLWAKQAQVWRYELQMGHGCVGPEPGTLPTFKFAMGVGRSRCVLS